MVLLLSISSIYATDASNNTAILGNASSSSPDIANNNQIITSYVKTFTDLANEINNTKENSVLVLKGKYKYNPDTDSKYKYGVTVSKSIKITGKDNCIIDGNGKARCLKITSKSKVTLDNITFRNGYAKEHKGGAIYQQSGTKVIIKNCVFKNNKATKSDGGAIAAGEKSSLKIYNTKFYNNKATRASPKKWPKDKRGMGGALYIDIGSTLTLSNCIFKYNEGYLSIILVLSHNSKLGNKLSTVYVKNCLFFKNTANYHGAFYLDEFGKGKFINTIFKKNVAKSKGGTLVLDASKYALVKNCKFIRNTGIHGAAMDLYQYEHRISHTKIFNCYFYKNKAKRAGGAIFSESAKAKIRKCKFIQNKAGLSGGGVELRKGNVKLIRNLFKKNKSRCGGAILVKDKKTLYSYKTKFIKNKATEKGNNIQGIFHNEISKVKVYPVVKKAKKAKTTKKSKNKK